MKRLFVLFSLMILVSGCSLVRIEEQSFEEIMQTIITGKTNLKNISLEGYSYYLPKGVMLKSNYSSNSILYYNHKKMYLYVDVVSYYHKVEKEYSTSEDNYVSIEIDRNGNQGYLEITKINSNYFIEFMYHYAKLEAYASETDLKKTVTTMAYILNSVQYHDAVLNTLIGENTLNYHEETFNIFKPKREEGSFLDYEEQYQFDSSNKSDEDEIDLGESIE